MLQRLIFIPVSAPALAQHKRTNPAVSMVYDAFVTDERGQLESGRYVGRIVATTVDTYAVMVMLADGDLEYRQTYLSFVDAHSALETAVLGG